MFICGGFGRDERLKRQKPFLNIEGLQEDMKNKKFTCIIQGRTFWEMHHTISSRIRKRTFSSR